MTTGCGAPIGSVPYIAMSSTPRRYRMTRALAEHLCSAALWALAIGALLLTTLLGHAWQQDPKMSGMAGMSTDPSGHPCDDMGSRVNGMSVMGQSMAAMTNHMCITPMRPKQPGDEEKAKALVAEVKATIEKYKDYKK